MNKEPTAPERLERTQKWFANIITQPLLEKNAINPITPSGTALESDSKKYILPSPTLVPWQRIQIYNQQYWWRILDILKNNYPLLTALFSKYDFEQRIAIPFMEKYPSVYWAIDMIGNRLPKWILEEYKEPDLTLIYEAACVDNAYNISFFSKMEQLAVTDDQEALLHAKASLQSHVFPLTLEHALLPFRDEVVKEEPDYWIEHDFPTLESEGPYHYIIYCNRKGHVVWESCDPIAFAILNLFEEGCSIERACEWIEEQDASFKEQALNNIHLWFQEWTIRQWVKFQ